MKFSEAIRLGSMLKPQHFGGVYKDEDHSASCAMGAAIDAIGCSFRPSTAGEVSSDGRGASIAAADTSVVRIPQEWWWYCRERQTCPECKSGGFGITIIAHLNDGHRWTRERIADHIEHLENQRSPSPIAERREAAETPSVK